MSIRTDRIGLLVEQLTDGVALSRARIDGISHDEFVWEPHSDMWSIRRRSDAATPDAYGPGEHVLDFDRSREPFGGGPLSTIAWRIGHLVSIYAGRYEWTFGARDIAPNELVHFQPTTAMLDQLWAEIDRWVAAIEAMSREQLDEPGFGQYPNGLDPHIAFIGIIGWMNRETIHHLAEVALLRDLYLASRW